MRRLQWAGGPLRWQRGVRRRRRSLPGVPGYEPNCAVWGWKDCTCDNKKGVISGHCNGDWEQCKKNRDHYCGKDRRLLSENGTAPVEIQSQRPKLISAYERDVSSLATLVMRGGGGDSWTSYAISRRPRCMKPVVLAFLGLLVLIALALVVQQLRLVPALDTLMEPGGVEMSDPATP